MAMSNDPLKLLPFDVGKLRTQDVVVLVVGLAAVFLFRAPYVWDLKPSWQLHIASDESEISGKKYVPLPVVTDLDSDGLNEVIVTTMDSKIQVLVLPSHEDEDRLSSILPHLDVKKDAVLYTKSYNPSSSTFPVALGAGCDRKSTNSLDVCRQIIVVVTNDGVVQCFTDQLELLWTADTFQEQIGSHSQHFKEIAVHIAPYSLDFGLVLIGGKLAKDEPPEDHLKHDHHLNTSGRLSADEVARLPPRRVRPAKMSSEEKEHFSTYALNSKTGQIHWKHEPSDYEAKKTSREDLLSTYHFKLALHSSQYHVGEVRLSSITDSLITTLPYRWQHPSDTKLQTAHFVKKLPSSSTDTNHKATAGASQPHSSRGRPNAVVIHQRKAIEVLSLDTGRPLCASYPIPKDHTSLGDVNNDNVIEHVTTFFSSEPVVQSDLTPCSAVVVSGGRILFRGSVCRPASTLGSYFSSTSDEDLRSESVLVAPLLVPSPSGRTGVFSHLSGDKFRRESIRGFDSIFLISSGRLTNFGPYGEFNWQTDTRNSWEKYGIGEESQGEVFVPNIQAVSTSVGGVEDAVLVSGWKHLTLVSLKDGNVLASHSLPCVCDSPVTQGDFSNDGLMDFIVHCEKSYLGFSLENRPGYWWTGVGIACGMGVVLIAFFLLRAMEEFIA